jgi:hypothetical protein
MWLGPCLALAVFWTACNSNHAQGDPGMQAAFQADAIVHALKATGLPIGDLRTYDPALQATDSPLAPPVRFVSMASFRDTRLTSLSLAVELEDGGQVLVVANPAASRQLVQWLEMVSDGAPFHTFNYSEGTVVLRLSDRLTAAQAAAYDQALQQVLSNVATPGGG